MSQTDLRDMMREECEACACKREHIWPPQIVEPDWRASDQMSAMGGKEDPFVNFPLELGHFVLDLEYLFWQLRKAPWCADCICKPQELPDFGQWFRKLGAWHRMLHAWTGFLALETGQTRDQLYDKFRETLRLYGFKSGPWPEYERKAASGATGKAGNETCAAASPRQESRCAGSQESDAGATCNPGHAAGSTCNLNSETAGLPGPEPADGCTGNAKPETEAMPNPGHAAGSTCNQKSEACCPGGQI